MVPIALVLLGGCATLPRDLGRSDVDALVEERGQPVEASASKTSQTLVVSLTAEPLTAESAIRVALVNNPRLKASYAQLGFAAADVYEAGRIRNPIFSATLLDSNRSGDRDQNTFGLVTSFTDILTLSSRKRLATAEFSVMKQSIGAEVLEVAADAEAAYYWFVAAKQVAALRKQVAKAGALSAALAERYHEAGNLTPRDLALERAAASEAQLDKLAAVATDILGKSGREMLEALVGDSADANAMAELAKGRMREKIPQLERALAGQFAPTNCSRRLFKRASPSCT